MTPSPNFKRLRLRCLLFLLFLIPLLTISLFSQAPAPQNQPSPPQTPEQLQAQEILMKGVNDFKSGQYEDAIRDFSRAKQLDPRLLDARLYLAITYATIYVPGSPSESNKSNALAAIKENKEVLSLDPENLRAIDGLGSVIFQMAGTPFDPGMFAESRSYHMKHIQLQPEDPEPYYWVGVIDWTLAYRANAQIRAAYNQDHTHRPIRVTDPLPRDLREAYRHNFEAIILEGVDLLQKAIERRPDYDDAMAYLNLLYRMQADTVETNAERNDLLERADELIVQVKEIQQKRSNPQN